MTGGGTGGHLAIVRAVKEAIGRSEEVGNKSGKRTLVYVGSTKGQDKQWFSEDSAFAAKYFFETKGVVNQRGFGRLVSLWMMLRATVRAVGLIRKHQVEAVFSVGGFSAAPMAFAAKLTRTPLVIHEQNAALGSLNRLLRPYATAFISSYLPESPIHAYPIKQVFFDKARIREQVETVIFLGGSQGAAAINTLALDLAPTLHERGIRIIHQAGERHIETVQEVYVSLGIEAEVFGFTDSLADYMVEADLAIARAGASTLWELSATALPTLYIPYPYAASDHQYYNAQFLVEKELAWLMREDAIDREAVIALMDAPLAERSRGLMKIVEKDGAIQIADLLTQF